MLRGGTEIFTDGAVLIDGTEIFRGGTEIVYRHGTEIFSEGKEKMKIKNINNKGEFNLNE